MTRINCPVIYVAHRTWSDDTKTGLEFVYTADCKPAIRVWWKGGPSNLLTMSNWPAWWGKEA